MCGGVVGEFSCVVLRGCLPADRPGGGLVLLHPVAQFLDHCTIVPLDSSLRFGVARFPMHHHKGRPELSDLGDDFSHELRFGEGVASGASEGVEEHVVTSTTWRAPPRLGRHLTPCSRSSPSL